LELWGVERIVGVYVSACRGELETARVDAEEILRVAERSGALGPILQSLELLGAIELLRGNPVEAHAHLGRAWELERETGSEEPNRAWFAPDEIDALIQLGELERAEQIIEWLEDRGQALDRPRALATGARCRGLLLAARGDLDGAIASLDLAEKEHERLTDPFELGRTLLVAGSLRRRAKQKRPASDALAKALEIFERLGAGLWAQRTRAELAAIGGRPAATGELTSTELRVAHLAIAGRTNREIAAAMFISVRTVETHLSRVYHKLGVRSRTELGPVFQERDVRDS
jgi:DNA-binding CsgD family transcriptional regulator